MVDSLDISMKSLCVFSPPSKLAADEALHVHGGHVEGGDIEDDAESFNEEDCLFDDMAFEGEEVHEASARLNSLHIRPHSATKSNEKNVAHEGPFSRCSRASACLRPNSVGKDTEEEAYAAGAFAHYSRPSMKLKVERPRLASVLARSHREKENESPSATNIGAKSCESHRLRLRKDRRPGCEPSASFDGGSLPLDVVPAFADTAAMRRSRKSKKNNLSVRESLLAEAWERKREHMLHEELANVKERAKPELLGRSSSDCGKLIADVQAGVSQLRRSRTRSLTEDDFDELRGCIDLGFQFDQSSIPDLCDTLPALQVYCAVAQSFQDSPNCTSPVIQSPVKCSSPSSASSWKISSPGDDPREVKGRLKHWAQAVACNARLCH